jgi:hypothetical protein
MIYGTFLLLNRPIFKIRIKGEHSIMYLKKLLIMCSVCSLLFSLVGCINKIDNPLVKQSQLNRPLVKETQTPEDIRQLAYEQLTSESKEEIKGTWRDGNLSTVTLNEQMGIIDDKSYIGKEVYLVDFTTKRKGIPNNVIYYISKDTHKLIGVGFVD